MQEISFGPYAVPVIMTVVLSVIYKFVGKVPNRFKPVIAILVGVGLGLLSLGYEGGAWEFRAIVDRVLYGFMTGCSAVGLYEIARNVGHNPR